MLDESKSPLPKFELGSHRRETERSKVSRTIVGGNLELSNRASLEQTNGSISERAAESLAESRIAAPVGDFEAKKREPSAKTKTKPKAAT